MNEGSGEEGFEEELKGLEVEQIDESSVSDTKTDSYRSNSNQNVNVFSVSIPDEARTGEMTNSFHLPDKEGDIVNEWEKAKYEETVQRLNQVQKDKFKISTMIDKYLNHPNREKMRRKTIFREGNSLDLNLNYQQKSHYQDLFSKRD